MCDSCVIDESNFNRNMGQLLCDSESTKSCANNYDVFRVPSSPSIMIRAARSCVRTSPSSIASRSCFALALCPDQALDPYWGNPSSTQTLLAD